MRLKLRRERSRRAPPAPVAPLPRAHVVPHHWLTLAVVRAGPSTPVPVAGATLVVRPFPRGAKRPEDVVARGATGAEGSFAVSLPPGRYAVYAQHEGEGKAVTVTLEHAGRATLMLESLGRRVTLAVEVAGYDGLPLVDADVEIRSAPGGAHVARATTHFDGVAEFSLPPGGYEVHVAGAKARTFLESYTVVRLVGAPPLDARAPPPLSRYAQRALAARAEAEVLDIEEMPDDAWN